MRARFTPANVLEHTRKLFAGDSKLRGLIFDYYVKMPGVEAMEGEPEEAASHLFARFLTRAPGPDELKPLAEHLRPGFASRVVDGASSDRVAAIEIAARAYRTPVSWSNHLSAEATTIKLELEKKARAGDEPTKRFTADWRQRVEDVIWALMNSPEFLFVP